MLRTVLKRSSPLASHYSAATAVCYDDTGKWPARVGHSSRHLTQGVLDPGPGLRPSLDDQSGLQKIREECRQVLFDHVSHPDELDLTVPIGQAQGTIHSRHDVYARPRIARVWPEVYRNSLRWGCHIDVLYIQLCR